VQKKAQEELDMDASDRSLLSFKKIEKLRYFNSVLKESMRFYSTAPIGTMTLCRLLLYSPLYRGSSCQYRSRHIEWVLYTQRNDYLL
jgi:hypothetical protein